MINDSAVITPSDRVEYRRLGPGDGAVLLRLDTGAYHGINDVGALVWTLLDGSTFAAVVDAARSQLDDAPDSLDDELGTFLRELEERGLVTIADG
jgi:hypothetical protein